MAQADVEEDFDELLVVADVAVVQKKGQEHSTHKAVKVDGTSPVLEPEARIRQIYLIKDITWRDNTSASPKS